MTDWRPFHSGKGLDGARGDCSIGQKPPNGRWEAFPFEPGDAEAAGGYSAGGEMVRL